MSDPEYAAHCDCDAFGVSTAGTDWDRAQLEALVRTHLQGCAAEEIDLVERTEDGETVVETLTPGVTAP